MIVEPGEVAIVAIIFGSVSGTILSLARMRLRSREQHTPLTDPGVEDRLYRIEQAVDAIALEVERMAESQRFTARLLSDRLPTPEALPGAERGRT
jgi:hypothetical protein